MEDQERSPERALEPQGSLMTILEKLAATLIIVAIVLISALSSSSTVGLVDSIFGPLGVGVVAATSLTVHCMHAAQMFFEWLSQAIEKKHDR